MKALVVTFLTFLSLGLWIDVSAHVTIAKTGWETKGYKKGTTEKLTGSSKVNLV